MSRLSLRRSLGLESLELRQVLSAGGPSAEAQAMLELINQARTNPAAAADLVTSNPDADLQATIKYYNVDLNGVRNAIASSAPRPPIAWSDALAQTADGQSHDQANSGVQSHTGADGSNLDQRLDRAGYTNRASSGENAYAYSQSVDHAMDAFLIDWGVAGNGHRNNLLQPNASPDQFYKEVGIGIVNTNRANFGPEVITQDFGTRAGQPAYLLGVAYNDSNHNNKYDMGEGQGNVEVDVTNVDTGETRSTQTWDAGGGYQIPLSPGTYSVTAKVGDQVVRTDRVSIGSQNVKVDYNLSNPWQGGSAPTFPAPVAKPVVATPTPTPVASPVTVTATVASDNSWNLINPASQSISAPSKSAPLRTSMSWFGNSWSAWTARRANA